MSKKPTNRGSRKTAQRAALSAYAQTGNLRLALEAAKVGRRTHYDWLRDDPEYAAAFERAREEAADRLEEEAVRRAIQGVRRKRFTARGDPVIDPETKQQYEELVYSDTLLIFLLKGLRPEKFRESVTVVQTTGVQVHQVAGDVAAMAGTVLPPPEAVQAALRAAALRQIGHEPGGNGNGNGSGAKDAKGDGQ